MYTVPSRDRFVHQVDVWIADTENTDPSGSLVPNPSLQKAGVQCLVTDFGGGRVSAFQRELERKRVMVLFCDLIDLKQGIYLKYTNPSGVVRWLLVQSFRDDQDLGRLWVAECEENVDPTT
jgi:hypothetical protein